MKQREIPLGDSRWLFGNLFSGRMIISVGNNISFRSPTLDRLVTLQRAQPGGIDATPDGFVFEGLNSSIIHGGFYVFGDKLADDEAAHDVAHMRLADSFFQEGLFDVLEDGCRKSVDDSAEGIQPWINMGKVHMHKGDYYKAEAAFKRAMLGEPVLRAEKLESLIWTHNYLGNCYDLLGHRDMALEEYQQVIDLGNNYRGAVDYAKKYLAKPFKKGADNRM
jgi:tetratricopeptide (TPR) repeat protein